MTNVAPKRTELQAFLPRPTTHSTKPSTYQRVKHSTKTTSEAQQLLGPCEWAACVHFANLSFCIPIKQSPIGSQLLRFHQESLATWTVDLIFMRRSATQFWP